MCHILLSMPVLALAVFWWWPFTVALPVYLVILALSIWLYVLTLRAMHAPAQLGREGMLHESGQVIGVDGEGLRVRVHNEIWNAETGEALQVGERVRVVGLRGLTLTVQRLDAASRPSPAAGAVQNRRRCDRANAMLTRPDSPARRDGVRQDMTE